MTGSDRARLAQIAAYGPELGETPAATERRMREYMSDASEADIARAFTEGALARDVAERMNAGTIGFTQPALGGDMPDRYGLGVAFVRFRIGPGNNDWRTVKVDFGPGQSVGAVRQAVSDRIAEVAAKDYGSDVGAAWSSMEFIALTPAL